MKTNKGLIIGLAVAGAAIAGAVIFLTTTKKGKKTLKTWGESGKKIVGKAEDLLKDARKKAENLRQEYIAKEEVLTNSYE
jgi:gas vesicle protein